MMITVTRNVEHSTVTKLVSSIKTPPSPSPVRLYTLRLHDLRVALSVCLPAFLINKVEQTRWSATYQIQTAGVVHKIHVSPIDSFRNILILCSTTTAINVNNTSIHFKLRGEGGTQKKWHRGRCILSKDMTLLYLPKVRKCAMK